MKAAPLLALLLVHQAAAGAALAEEPKKPAAESSKTADGEADLTPEEKAEKAARQSCKVDICRAFHSKDTSGEIACHVVKSWRKEQLVKLVGKLKVKWPYEGVRCLTDLSVKRGDLVQAMGDGKSEITFATHSVTCTIAKDEKGPTEFKFELTPKVTFENGKATRAHANWGKIEAPTLIKSALWTATAADNAVNVLSDTIVTEVNDFISKRCDEVKEQWATKR